MTQRLLLFCLALALMSCSNLKTAASGGKNAGAAPFIWDNANIYFLLTDRFYNADPSNDVQFSRTAETGKLRGFMGGDLKGVVKKLEEGYFDRLGITAIWCTPFMEQIHGAVDEGSGVTYGFHGYWTRDWTRLDPNFGTEADLAKLVETAHRHGIRVLLDVVINHTGPVTGQDPLWPPDWVRADPQCTYQSYATTIPCTLVKNLPDVKTENNTPTGLPPALTEKWKREGRLDRELAELDAFFQRSGYPRAPRFYIIKWLTDYIRKFGIDGYRCDTAKHIEESVWAELRKEADAAFEDWKKAHPGQALDATPFYMVGEVYGYNIAAARQYDFGDRKVNYFAEGFNSLINFGFKGDAWQSYEALFSTYSNLLHNPLQGKSVLNYVSSHDDGGPFDKERAKPIEAGTKLLLCPGAAQVYYGDETSRPLTVAGAEGDANLRSFMNWDELAANTARQGHRIREVLTHWQKLGQFRKAHPAVGAGVHVMISRTPYVFRREYTAGTYRDAVVVGLDLPAGEKEIDVRGVFPEGARIRDFYSGKKQTVENGKVRVDSKFGIVLLGQ